LASQRHSLRVARRQFSILIILLLVLSALTASASLPRNAFPNFSNSIGHQASCTIYARGAPTVTNIYDARGNPFKIQNNTGTPIYLNAKGYDQLGQLLGINFGNGTESTFSYFVNVSGNEFRAEIESGFLRFNYLTNSGGNSWVVSDKSGNKYFFGETTDSRKGEQEGSDLEQEGSDLKSRARRVRTGVASLPRRPKA